MNRSGQEYYEAKSSATEVSRVTVPLLVLHADDDPLIRPDDLPVARLVANPHVIIVRTRWGGHIGWGVGVLPMVSASWAEPLVVDFLAARLRVAQQGACEGGRSGPLHPHPPVFVSGDVPPHSRL